MILNTFAKASIIVLIGVFALSTCIDKNSHTIAENIKNNYGESFAGTESCKSCHAGVYHSFVHTGHYLSARPGDKQFIKGSFEEGKNFLAYNLYDRVVMQERDSGLYQASYYKNTEKRAERIDMVIGSGIRGQSYLYKKEPFLYQLPVSYFTPLAQWSNSPGNGGSIVYNRLVYARCLECHTTYAKTLNNSSDRFDATQIYYGVNCENCHGAAAKHVSFHTQNPTEKQARYIVNPGKLTRQQQLDECALCHSGTMQNLKPAFTFRPGDTLSHFYTSLSSLSKEASADVHGNKYNLFTKSKCYQNSNTLTCATCHNTHKQENGDLAAYSQKCMSCHTSANHNFCRLASEDKIITENCVDCHMPKKASTMLSVYVPESNATTSVLIREHQIAVYPEETQKVLAYLKSVQKKKTEK